MCIGAVLARVEIVKLAILRIYQLHRLLRPIAWRAALDGLGGPLI